jgi:hypothetical protein
MIASQLSVSLAHKCYGLQCPRVRAACVNTWKENYPSVCISPDWQFCPTEWNPSYPSRPESAHIFEIAWNLEKIMLYQVSQVTEVGLNSMI